MADTMTPPLGGAGAQDARPPLVPANLAALAALPDDCAITADQVASLLACSVRHVWRLADAGDLPAPVPIGRLRRWRVGTIRQFLREGGTRDARRAAR